MTYYIDEYMLKDFPSWEAYGYALSEAYYESCLQSGMPEYRAFDALKLYNLDYQHVEIFEMTHGRFQLMLDITKRWLGFGNKPNFPRTASNYEQEGYNFASFVFDREMENMNDQIGAVHAFMVHRREPLLNELPLTNREAYRKGYRRFCGETAEQLATHLDMESRGIKDPVAYLKSSYSLEVEEPQF